MNDNEFILLMEEYFDGSLLPEGKEALRKELQANPDRRALFEAQARQHIRLHAQTSTMDFSESQRIAISVIDTVAAERHPATFADILKEQSFRERVKAIREGLKAPHYSGKYRYARFVLFRVFGPPLMTLILCILIITALALAVPRFFPIGEEPEGIRINLRPSEPIEPPPEQPPPAEPASPPQVPTPATPSLPPPEEPQNFTIIETIPITGTVTTQPIPRQPPARPTLKSLPSAMIGRTPEARTAILKKTRNTQTEKAVYGALQWLKVHQQAGGSWEGQDPIAMTGLALLAFLGHGETTDSPEFGPTVQRGLQYLSTQQDPAGYFSRNVYAHAIATYAVAEAFTMTRIFALREALEKGTAIVIKGQQVNGGFDYNYSLGPRYDTSVTGWQIQAMKAARIAGASNPGLDAAMEKCVRFLKTAAYALDGSGFIYSAQNTSTPPQSGATWTMTGVGTLSLHLLGATDSTQARRGHALLADLDFPWTANDKPKVYGAYYVTQALFQSPNPNAWDRWNRQMQHALLAAQHRDGHWENGDYDQGSHVYTTTLCTLMLEVYYRYLPTYAQTGGTNNPLSSVVSGVPVDVR